MNDLYSRLRAIGYEPKFVREWLLPAWWDDSLAKEPANRALAEASLARSLRLSISELRNPSAALSLPEIGPARLKRVKGSDISSLQPSLVLARETACWLAAVLEETGRPATCPASARDIRKAILSKRAFVDLSALLDFAWSQGIVVFHLAQLPGRSKRLAGAALYAGGRPAISLSSRQDGPAWLAFHLAHELGHVMLGHVTADSILADAEIGPTDSDRDEAAADRFACELLTGHEELSFGLIYGLTGERLATQARLRGAEWGVDPGVIALFYGRSADRMGVAQRALKMMGLSGGARQLIVRALLPHIPEDVRSEDNAFVSLVSAAA